MRMVPVVLLTLLGCAPVGSPVPIRGDVSALVGEWDGDYESPDTGRHGSIVFTLRPGQDTASGDVLMIPANPEPMAPRQMDDPAHRAPHLLQISFVRCEGGQVTGWIIPYPDPDTGEKTYTSFTGSLKADTLAGTFVAHAEQSGKRSTGTWRVVRSKAKPKSTGSE
jgi:hypothetical protein